MSSIRAAVSGNQIAVSEVSTAGLAMMPWFPGDFMRSTRGWSVTAKGVYRELLDAQWDMGELPENLDELRQTIGATAEEWESGWRKCESKFPVRRGKRLNLRLETHRAKSKQIAETRSEVGRRGGQASAEAKLNQRSTEGQPIAQAKSKHPVQSIPIQSDPVRAKPKSKISIPSESQLGPSGPNDVYDVFNHWRKVWNHPNSRMDSKRFALIKKALERYTVAELCECLSGFLNSPFHRGENDRSTIYDGLKLLLRDSDQIDTGLRFSRNPPVLSSKLTQHNIAVLNEWRPPEMRNETAGLSEISVDDGSAERDVRQRALPASH